MRSKQKANALGGLSAERGEGFSGSVERRPITRSTILYRIALPMPDHSNVTTTPLSCLQNCVIVPCP